MGSKGQQPLFQPFRALGYITDDVPFAVQRRGKETYVTVSVGKAWQVYNTGKLTLTLVGPQLKGNIRALAAKGDLTFAAVGRDIVECKRVHRSGVYRGHAAPILQLMVLGDVLLSLGSDGQLLRWRVGSYEAPEGAIQLPAHCRPTCMAHPDTYLNKVVVGCDNGQLLLYNFVSGALLYTFNGWGSAVRCIASSPALDVVGVALADGRAALLNLRFDETVCVLANAAGVGLASDVLLGGSAGGVQAPAAVAGAGAGAAGCTALAFRTGAGVPLMAAGGSAGVITVWNLEERRLHTVIRDAHDAPLTCLHFFPGEPLLMSAGGDNALKQWLFDQAEPSARLLRFRSGHAAPPTVVAHYGEGLRLLSAGADRAFRVFSTIQDQQSRELSQGHTARRAKRLKVRESDIKLGRVTALDACTVRERDWANVLTAHEGDAVAYVWRLAHFTLGEHELAPPPHVTGPPPGARRGGPPPEPSGGRTGAPVTTVALSPCGNFGLVGSASGRIDRYNMQSGLHRGMYGRAPLASATTPGGAGAPTQGAAPSQQGQGSQQQPQAPVLRAAHEGAVSGLAVDGCNRLMASAGLDGVLRVWEFRTGKLKHEVAVGSPVSRLALHRGSGLCAVACDDLSIRVYDIEAAGRLVRRFKGHSDRITGLQLSEDCRWLLSSSMDGTLRVWDVPAALCLQVMRLGSPVTAFSLSPALDMLATCHTNRRGLYMWSNQAVFGNPADFTHSERPVDVGLPTLAAGTHTHGPAGGAAEGKEGAAKGGKGGTVAAALRHTAGAAAAAAAGGSDKEDEDGGSSSGEEEEGAAGRGRGGRGGAAPMLLEEGDSSEEDEGWEAPEDNEEEEGDQQAGSEGQQAAAATAPAAHERRHAATGAPEPLGPSMVTLSLLPRSQWQSLLQLEAIKARNRPIEPPKKPEAAPFFLPTVAGLDPNPVFDTTAEAAAAVDGATEAGPASKVLRTKPGKGGAGQGGPGGPEAALPAFVRLLRAGQAAGDFTSFVAHIRGLSATALDREVRALQILAGADDDEEEDEAVEGGHGNSAAAQAAADVGALLECVEDSLAKGTNFEFCQALLQLTLQVHGDLLSDRPELKSVGRRLLAKLRPVWGRLDGSLQDVRSMVAFFGNLQS